MIIHERIISIEVDCSVTLYSWGVFSDINVSGSLLNALVLGLILQIEL